MFQTTEAISHEKMNDLPNQPATTPMNVTVKTTKQTAHPWPNPNQVELKVTQKMTKQELRTTSKVEWKKDPQHDNLNAQDGV